MSYTGVYDKTIYYNPVSKYCGISAICFPLISDLCGYKGSKLILIFFLLGRAIISFIHLLSSKSIFYTS